MIKINKKNRNLYLKTCPTAHASNVDNGVQLYTHVYKRKFMYKECKDYLFTSHTDITMLS